MQKKIQKAKRFKARTIVFTWNNPNLDAPEFIEELKNIVQWGLFQKEQGEKGTIHYQGMLHHHCQISWDYLKRKGAHIENCWAPLDSIAYCQKADTRIDGPWEFGQRPRFQVKGKKVPLTNEELINGDLKKLIDEDKLNWKLLKPALEFKYLYGTLKEGETLSSPKGIWYYGKPGTGKSYEVRRKYGDSLYLKSQNRWWNGYMGETNVLIDDFDHLGSGLSHYLKTWADQYPCQGEVKGGHVNLQYTRFIITSNYLPAQIWKGEENQELVEAIMRRFEFISWGIENRVTEASLACESIIQDKEINFIGTSEADINYLNMDFLND